MEQQRSKGLLTVVLPAYNEEASVPKAASQLSAAALASGEQEKAFIISLAFSTANSLTSCFIKNSSNHILIMLKASRLENTNIIHRSLRPA